MIHLYVIKQSLNLLLAVNKLIDRIHRENDVQMTQLLSTKIIERDSVK